MIIPRFFLTLRRYENKWIKYFIFPLNLGGKFSSNLKFFNLIVKITEELWRTEPPKGEKGRSREY